MARTNNKYTSINYNHILHKDPHSSSTSSSSSASYSSVARSNGRMLVLTKPSLKPLKSSAAATTTTTNITPPISQSPSTPDQAISDPDPNQISLRPLGHTGPGSSSLSFPARAQESEKKVSGPIPMAVSPKPDKFVPPHLRPGFVRKDEKPGHHSPRVSDPILNQRLPHQEQQSRQGHFGYGQTGRPKSGGYERIQRDPRSTGNRPGTSGWYDIIRSQLTSFSFLILVIM